MKPFQIGVTIAFAALALIAILIFATFSSGGRATVGNVVVWGTLDQQLIEDVLGDATEGLNQYDNVSYKQINSGDFANTLVESIASGTGPDLVIIPSSLVVGEQDKLLPIPYKSFSRRDFQDTFVQSGEIFLRNDGVYGLPFYIDPFVMFWNRTLFSNAGIARAPRYWDEFSEIAPTLSKISQNGTIVQSAVALGEWNNVRYAKEIFTSLVYGLGNQIVVLDKNDALVSTLSKKNENNSVTPGESALRFYTDFADPVKVMYSWNRSQQNSFDEFLAGRLSVYFGKASEIFSLRESNPNLNFDISSFPEVRNGFVAVPTEMQALSIPRGSKNTTGALMVAKLLTGVEAQKSIVTNTGLPSVRRDVLSVNPENPYESILRNSALNSFSLLDPDPKGTEAIFEGMVEAVSSGRLKVGEAVSSGNAELQALIKVQ